MIKLIGMVLCIVVGAILWNNYNDVEEINMGNAPTVEQYVEQRQTPNDEEYRRSIRRIPEILDRALQELRFFADARIKTQKWFADMASIQVRNMPQEDFSIIEEQKQEEEPEWVPDEEQVILFFYDDDNYENMVEQARQLGREGHIVYRAAPDRDDLYRQFDVRGVPLWLVVRNGHVIYRHNRAPAFPAYNQQKVEETVETTTQSSLDDRYQEMSEALERKDSFGIQHVTPGVSRYQTQGTIRYSAPRGYTSPSSCYGGVCR